MEISLGCHPLGLEVRGVLLVGEVHDGDLRVDHVEGLGVHPAFRGVRFSSLIGATVLLDYILDRLSCLSLPFD